MTKDEARDKLVAEWRADQDGVRRTLAAELATALANGAIDRWLRENPDAGLTREEVNDHVSFLRQGLRSDA